MQGDRSGGQVQGRGWRGREGGQVGGQLLEGGGGSGGNGRLDTALCGTDSYTQSLRKKPSDPNKLVQTVKVRSACLEKLAPGNSRGSLDFAKGRSHKGKSDDLRAFSWENFQITTENFPLFVRLLD